MIDGRDTTVSTGAQDTLGSPAAARTSIAGPVVNDVATVRIAGSWRITVRASRRVYAALFGCGSIAALVSARLSVTSSPFTQFVGPLLCGMIVGLLLYPNTILTDEQDETVHIPNMLAQVCSLLFLCASAAQFLPAWTPGAWIGFTGGVGLLGGLSLFDETRRAQSRRNTLP